MTSRVLRGVFAAFLVAALIAVPVLAARSADPVLDEARVPAADAETRGPDTSDTDEPGEERKGPPWATEGMTPPFGNAWGHGRGGVDKERKDDDNAGKGPPWARDSDGPPFGNAWGYWLNKGGDDACARIAARMQAHLGDGPPKDIRKRITHELGCDLPG